MIASSSLARKLLVAAGIAATLTAAAHAQVSWTDWQARGTNTVTGTMSFLGTPVGVTYSGLYAFADLSCADGPNYWNPNVYTGGTVTSAPGNCEIIGLSTGSSKTISFDKPVVNPLIAFVSWNGQGGIPFTGMNGSSAVTPTRELVASGHGYWGSGSISVSGNTFSPSGEAHGTVRVLGTYTSITFTDQSENWHGITVGAQSLATPEPATVALTATGLLALAGVARRRRS